MQIQPEQASFLLQLALSSLQNEYGITQKIIQAVPADQGDYRPSPDSMTALGLAWHIAAADHMFLGAVATGEFQYPGAKPDSIKTAADVSAWYADAFAKDMEALRARTGEQLAQTLDFRGMFQLPAVVFLQFSMNHTIHHRGQLSVYLRPMGSKVPSIYGESYDATQARKASGS